jgi:hypothetical protein
LVLATQRWNSSIFPTACWPTPCESCAFSAPPRRIANAPRIAVTEGTRHRSGGRRFIGQTAILSSNDWLPGSVSRPRCPAGVATLALEKLVPARADNRMTSWVSAGTPSSSFPQSSGHASGCSRRDQRRSVARSSWAYSSASGAARSLRAFGPGPNGPFPRSHDVAR